MSQRVIDLWDAVRFEVLTGWGQFRQRPHDGGPFDYLQVGSYDKNLAGFLNSDHHVHRSAAAHVDIRFPMPFADNRWRGIYAHHIVEHVPHDDAMTFFREAARTLAPGGWLRVIVPDVEKFIRLYCDDAPSRLEKMSALVPDGHRDGIKPMTPLGVVNNMFFSSPLNAHRSAWDFDTMRHSLREAGFKTVQKMRCGASNDPKMCGLDHQSWDAHSLYVEARK